MNLNRPVEIATRPQVALQSYLDALLQDATEDLPDVLPTILAPEPEPVVLDDFEAAVLEEQAHDARMLAAATPIAVAVAAPAPVAVPVAVAAPVVAPPVVARVEVEVEVVPDRKSVV